MMEDSRLSVRMAGLARDLEAMQSPEATLQGVVDAAVELIGPPDRRHLAGLAPGRIETSASTAQAHTRADELQQETGEGPCMDAVWEQPLVRVADLALEEERWPRWAPRAAHELGLRSMVSVACSPTLTGSVPSTCSPSSPTRSPTTTWWSASPSRRTRRSPSPWRADREPAGGPAQPHGHQPAGGHPHDPARPDRRPRLHDLRRLSGPGTASSTTSPPRSSRSRTGRVADGYVRRGVTRSRCHGACPTPVRGTATGGRESPRSESLPGLGRPNRGGRDRPGGNGTRGGRVARVTTRRRCRWPAPRSPLRPPRPTRWRCRRRARGRTGCRARRRRRRCRRPDLLGLGIVRSGAHGPTVGRRARAFHHLRGAGAANVLAGSRPHVG